MFAGVHTALVTPFLNGEVDETALRRLIDAQFEAGVQGVVPVGTTGESPTLNHEEHVRVIAITVEHTGGRGLVIAGTGSNSTSEAVVLTQAAEKEGADAALLVCPYYNKPSQEGLIAHFRQIAEATQLKLVLYSIPGRCGIEIGVETVATLAETCPNIVAIKEAGGTPERVSQLRDACPRHFEILSGDDSMTLPFISVGASGVISVAANLVPGVMSDLVQSALEGDFKRASDIHRQHYALFRDFLKLESNPVPIKAALALRGDLSSEVRLPLLELSAEKEAILRETLLALKIL